jgi:hypothetical protein
MNDVLWEAKEGLQEGDLVIVAPENSLHPGDRVRPIAD